MTDREARELRQNGLHLSTPESFKRRLEVLVDDGELTENVSNYLYSNSPLIKDEGQSKSRSNRFWLTSHPLEVDHGGVQRLLKNWGGEVASWWIDDKAVLDAGLTVIGRPRIIEISVPLALADYAAISAAKAMIGTFSQSHGAVTERCHFDLSALRQRYQHLLSSDSVSRSFISAEFSTF